MIKFLKVALAACVAVVAAAGSASAEPIYVYLTGTVTEDDGATSAWSLKAFYAPVDPSLPVGPTTIRAVITGADFSIFRSDKTYRWNTIRSNGLNEIRIAGSKTAYDLSVEFDGPALGTTTTGASHADINSLTVGGGVLLASQLATEANISLLTSTSTVLNGKFRLAAQAPFNIAANSPLYLDGIPASAIPEPGSMLLLSGLGLVAGRRVMARRRQQKANAEAEAAV